MTLTPSHFDHQLNRQIVEIDEIGPVQIFKTQAGRLHAVTFGIESNDIFDLVERVKVLWNREDTNSDVMYRAQYAYAAGYPD